MGGDEESFRNERSLLAGEPPRLMNRENEKDFFIFCYCVVRRCVGWLLVMQVCCGEEGCLLFVLLVQQADNI